MNTDEKTLPPTALIAVGFGSAEVTCDGETVYSEPDNANSWDDFWTCADAEIAAMNREGDWRIMMHAPLWSATYQRKSPGRWVMIESGNGFA